jgi:2-hydroxy-3-keto-5-methylthiopentenyl-1-phosphate phosphatase
MNCMFFCDVGATITKEEVMDGILVKFADPMWMDIEKVWVEGEGSHDWLARIDCL